MPAQALQALMRDERRYVRSGARQGLQEPIAKESSRRRSASARHQQTGGAVARFRCARDSGAGITRPAIRTAPSRQMMVDLACLLSKEL
jgi:hypothetical protein